MLDPKIENSDFRLKSSLGQVSAPSKEWRSIRSPRFSTLSTGSRKLSSSSRNSEIYYFLTVHFLWAFMSPEWSIQFEAIKKIILFKKLNRVFAFCLILSVLVFSLKCQKVFFWCQVFFIFFTKIILVNIK